MKHTIEQQAKEFAEKRHYANMRSGFFYRYDDLDMINAFKEGVNWQANQSPWISVEEQLPETNDGQSLYEVIVAIYDGRFQVVINTEVEHLVGLLGVTHWMPIPKFNG